MLRPRPEDLEGAPVVAVGCVLGTVLPELVALRRGCSRSSSGRRPRRRLRRHVGRVDHAVVVMDRVVEHLRSAGRYEIRMPSISS